MRASTLISGALWTLPVAFLNFWTVGRLVAYFRHNAEWNKADFAATVFPANIPANVAAGMYKQMDVFFNNDLKFITIRMHIAVAAAMGFICMLLLLPIFPRGSKLHRTLGWVYATLLVPFSLEMALTQFIHVRSNMGIVVYIGNTTSLVIMVITMPLAIYYARTHRIKEHRACMLLHAAALYVNPAQRFFWVLFSKSNFGAPYADFESWAAKPVAMADCAAFITNFAVALAYISMGPAQKAVKAKVA